MHLFYHKRAMIELWALSLEFIRHSQDFGRRHDNKFIRLGELNTSLILYSKLKIRLLLFLTALVT